MEYVFKEDEIIKENYGKKTYKEISIELSLNGFFRTACSVQARAKKINIQKKGKGNNCYFKHIQGKRKVFFNEYFFSTPNLINSYWAGFIAADGCISKDNKKLQLQIGDKDFEHLNKFGEMINFTGKITRYTRKNGIKMCNMSCGSLIFVNDLKNNFNITPQKTFTLKFPINLTLENRNAFLIGYIDGDGHISKGKNTNRKVPIRMGIVGANKDFIFKIREICNDILKDTKYFLKNNICKDKNKEYYRFYCSSRPAKTILTRLDLLEVPKLRRKWDRIK